MSYIDRERLLQDIHESIRVSGRPGSVSVNAELRGVAKVWDRIKFAPAADVEIVRHAHWEDNSKDDVCDVSCSDCKHSLFDSVPAFFPNFLPERCPVCGAYMDEEVKL